MSDKIESGIYNYCDRRCELCMKTSKCLLFAREQESNKGLIAKGIDPNSTEGAMIAVKESFSETYKLIQQIAKKEGIDLTISKEDEKEYDEFKRKTDPSSLPLYKKAKKLSNKISEWLEDTPFVSKNNFDALHDIGWHHSLIFVKTTRALRSLLESKIEKKPEHSKDDATKSGWVAYRSTSICKKAFEQMQLDALNLAVNDYVKDCSDLMKAIEKELLDK